MLKLNMLAVNALDDLRNNHSSQVLFPITKNSTMWLHSFLLSFAVLCSQAICAGLLTDKNEKSKLTPILTIVIFAVATPFLVSVSGFLITSFIRSRPFPSMPLGIKKRFSSILLYFLMSTFASGIVNLIGILIIHFDLNQEFIPNHSHKEIKQFIFLMVFVLANWPILYLANKYTIQSLEQETQYTQPDEESQPADIKDARDTTELDDKNNQKDSA